MNKAFLVAVVTFGSVFLLWPGYHIGQGHCSSSPYDNCGLTTQPTLLAGGARYLATLSKHGFTNTYDQAVGNYSLGDFGSLDYDYFVPKQALIGAAITSLGIGMSVHWWSNKHTKGNKNAVKQ